MTTHRLKLTALWAVAAGVAVAGGTSAIALADNHGVSPKPLSQRQVAQQLADAKHAPTPELNATLQVVPPVNLPKGEAIVTTRGGNEMIFCVGNKLSVDAFTQNVGWRYRVIDVPKDRSRLVARFSNGHDRVTVTAHCEAGKPKWTIS